MSSGNVFTRGFKSGVKGCVSCLTFAMIGLVVIVLIAAVATHKSKPKYRAADITNRVSSHFVTTGCFGCGSAGLVQKIHPSETYCGWDGKHVIVHVTFKNTSAETVTVKWHPSYSIRNGAAHGTGLTSLATTKIKPGASASTYWGESPKGVTAGTPLAKCDPSFFLVQSG